jgi:hypothetical protein
VVVKREKHLSFDPAVTDSGASAAATAVAMAAYDDTDGFIANDDGDEEGEEGGVGSTFFTSSNINTKRSMDNATQQWQEDKQSYNEPETEADSEMGPQDSVELFQQKMAAATSSEEYHAYINRANSVTDKPSSATRHRDAVKQSQSIQMATHGAGFRFTPSNTPSGVAAQEELALTLANSFRKDVSFSKSTTGVDMEVPRVNHMVQSQSESNMLGARRLVGVHKVGGAGGASGGQNY